MAKQLGDYTLREIVNICNNECDDCKLWNICRELDWNILHLAIADQEIHLLDEEIVDIIADNK